MSYIDLAKTSANPAPPSGFIRIKIGTDGLIYLIDSAGDVTGPLMLSPIAIPDAGVLEIDSGVITPTGMWHRVDTEGGGGSDDLDTINSFAGNLLLLAAYASGNVVTLKHNTGNIFFSDAADVVLSATTDFQLLFYDGTQWVNLQ